MTRAFFAILDALPTIWTVDAGDLKAFLYESLFGLYASIPPDWRINGESEAKRYFQLFA